MTIFQTTGSKPDWKRMRWRCVDENLYEISDRFTKSPGKLLVRLAQQKAWQQCQNTLK